MRGGGSRGGRGVNKRQATTPVGGAYKDSRRDQRDQAEGRYDALYNYDDDEDEGWTDVTRKPKTPPINRQNVTDRENSATTNEATATAPTYAGVAGSSGRPITEDPTRQDRHEQRLRPTKFLTPPPEGSMRDDIAIEVQTLNGAPFKGSISITEATQGIFRGCLDLNVKLIHGLRFGYSTYPLIKFKLKEQIDVDSLYRVEHFNYERRYIANGEAKVDILACKIKGIRTPGNEGGFNEPDTDPNIRWVKIEWADYGLKEEQILAWLEIFGEKAGELTEDLHPMPPNSDSESEPYCTGTYSIKMRLRTDMPQIIPMCGKRIRVYHKGIQKLCSNCFGNHQRRNCRSAKVQWIEYVLRFMEKYPDIPEELYGRWWKIVNEEYGEIVRGEDSNPGMDQDNVSSNNTNIEETRKEKETRETGTREKTAAGRVQSSEWPTTNPRVSTLTREEEENLADYLDLGLSISEAREQFQTEQRAAEIRFRIRENRRNQTRGAVDATRRTTTGMTNTRGRGGLSFN